MSCRRAQALSPVPRILVRPDEAAASLGVGETWFRTHVLPEVPVIRREGTRLIRVSDLHRWAQRQPTTIGDPLS